MKQCYNCDKTLPNTLGLWFCDEKCHQEWLDKNPAYAKGAKRFSVQDPLPKPYNQKENQNEKANK